MNKQWILVTGASTGIGRACAEHLASEGFGVYACARRKTDLDNLGGISNIVSLKLDVTRAKDIIAALAFIKKRKTGLFGLVNNAGIAVAGPLIDIPDSDLHRQFDVNIFGIHRVTRTFLPLLMESQGRIVMMSSDSGFFATPFVGPYCASKFALEGYSDSLRRELLLCGVKVIIVQPGRIATPIWDKTEKLLNLEGTSPFIEVARKIGREAVRKGRAAGLPPEAIARVVHTSLMKKRPRLRYLVASSTMKYRIIKILPASKIDKMVKQELLRH